VVSLVQVFGWAACQHEAAKPACLHLGEISTRELPGLQDCLVWPATEHQRTLAGWIQMKTADLCVQFVVLTGVPCCNVTSMF
jgi:hypothetical protein